MTTEDTEQEQLRRYAQLSARVGHLEEPELSFYLQSEGLDAAQWDSLRRGWYEALSRDAAAGRRDRLAVFAESYRLEREAQHEPNEGGIDETSVLTTSALGLDAPLPFHAATSSPSFPKSAEPAASASDVGGTMLGVSVSETFGEALPFAAQPNLGGNDVRSRLEVFASLQADILMHGQSTELLARYGLSDSTELEAVQREWSGKLAADASKATQFRELVESRRRAQR